MILKFLLWRGRFPRGRHELADDAVDHVARQVGVAADEFGSYDMTSRTAQRHRTEIRHYTGFRECSVADAEKLAFWLARSVAESERREGRFTAVAGAVAIAEELGASSVEVIIEMGSVESGNKTRDDHLRSGDFFDVDAYPTAIYRSTVVSWAGTTGTSPATSPSEASPGRSP